MIFYSNQVFSCMQRTNMQTYSSGQAFDINTQILDVSNHDLNYVLPNSSHTFLLCELFI